MELPRHGPKKLSKSWNQFGKLLGARLIGMQVKCNPYQDDGTTRGSKEESKGREFASLLSTSSESRGPDSS